MIIIVELIMLGFAMAICWTYAYMLYGEFKGAPFVPTSGKTEEEIWNRFSMQKGKYFIDVGSGDGRIVMEAARRYGVSGLGIEIQPILVWWSNWQAKIAKMSGVKFVKNDFRKISLSDADYLYFYMGPKTVEELARKLEREQKKDQIIINKAFEIKSWKDKVIDSWQTKNGRVWVYKLKIRDSSLEKSPPAKFSVSARE